MLDEDKGKPSEDPLPLQARKSFDRLVDGWADIKSRAMECMKCLSPDGPWPDKERTARNTEGQERPCIHEDMLTQYVNKVVNQMEGNPIGIEVGPDGDAASKEEAQHIENRIRHIDYESNAIQAREAAFESAVQQSIGVWEVGTDWERAPSGDLGDMTDLKSLFRQKITTIAAQDTWSYVLDCDSIKPDWSDQKEAFKLSWLSHEEFRQKFPKAEIKDFQGLINSDTTRWLTDSQVQVAEWWRVETDYRKLLIIADSAGEETAVWADKLSEEERKGSNVVDERDVEHFKVMKRLTNGLEILNKKKNRNGVIEEGIEWPDYEIPLLVTTGRVKVVNGKREIIALIHPAIPGQMIHDYTVSAIQEETNRAVKTKAWGPEGTFSTSTQWDKLHREPTTYAEFKVLYNPDGSMKPAPEMIESSPQIAALLEAKQSNLIDIQNMLGMSSTERLDRTAKSGKALESLDETMSVATYHFNNSLKMQVEREGRIKARLLKAVEPKKGKVSIRSAKGDHSVVDIPEGVYDKKYTVVISTGKAYKNRQEEIRDVAGNLTKSGDPSVQMAAWPPLIRAMDLGPEMEVVADELEAIQPPAMQQARNAANGKGPEPQQQLAQLQQTVQALQQHNQQMQAMMKQQAQVLDSKIVENTAKKDIEGMKISADTTIALAKLDLERFKIEMSRENALIAAKAKTNANEASIESDQRIAAEEHSLDFDLNQLDHHQGMRVMDQQHQQGLEVQAGDQAHQADMQGQQMDAAAQSQESAQEAAQNQGSQE